MRINKLLKRIVETQPSDWRRLGPWGSSVGSLPECRVVCKECGAGAVLLPSRSHDEHAVLKNHIAVTLAWGMDDKANFQEDWATAFPDARASSAFVDVFYNGSRVYRDSYVIVDGGRAFLPMPPSPEDLRIAPAYSALIELIAALTRGLCEYARYFQRASFLRTDDLAWPNP
jgi:hypothetical protein